MSVYIPIKNPSENQTNQLFRQLEIGVRLARRANTSSWRAVRSAYFSSAAKISDGTAWAGGDSCVSPLGRVVNSSAVVALVLWFGRRVRQRKNASAVRITIRPPTTLPAISPARFFFFGARGGTQTEGDGDDGTVLDGEGEDYAVIDRNEEDDPGFAVPDADALEPGGAGAPVAAIWTPNGSTGVSFRCRERLATQTVHEDTVFDVARQRALVGVVKGEGDSKCWGPTGSVEAKLASPYPNERALAKPPGGVAFH
ncbi:hypothetical protein DFH08DRAFT_803858 [Mycena albidolilacea]|uniref:Uncharacterized protein n=1 Tax=Mycena albidolilacea TaxID=1033008 RepID=A0AAD7ADV9_9AGAR|nr:hypothetical protein DFH08DRAFT_803858 [Mycena albidolilacea]